MTNLKYFHSISYSLDDSKLFDFYPILQIGLVVSEYLS